MSTPKSRLTPEQRADIAAELEDIFGHEPLPRPKVVTQESVTVRDADVHVSRADVNAQGAEDAVVAVRRADFVTINMAEYERQREDELEDRRRRRQLDPYRLGHWGSVDDQE